MSQKSHWEPDSQYNGPAEIWLDGAKLFDAKVRLTRHIEVTVITTIGRVQEERGRIKWDGLIDGRSQGELFPLVGKNFELHLSRVGDSDGRIGRAILPSSGPDLRGSGDPPFD